MSLHNHSMSLRSSGMAIGHNDAAYASQQSHYHKFGSEQRIPPPLYRSAPAPALQHCPAATVLAPGSYHTQPWARVVGTNASTSTRPQQGGGMKSQSMASQPVGSAAAARMAQTSSQAANYNDEQNAGSVPIHLSSLSARCTTPAGWRASQQRCVRPAWNGGPTACANNSNNNGIDALSAATSELEAGVAAVGSFRQQQRSKAGDDPVDPEGVVLAELRALGESLQALCAATTEEHKALQRLHAAVANTVNQEQTDDLGAAAPPPQRPWRQRRSRDADSSGVDSDDDSGAAYPATSRRSFRSYSAL